MRKPLNRVAVVLLMAIAMITMSFAMISENTFAAIRMSANPRIIKAIVVNNNTVRLKWNQAKKAVKYKVYRKKADGKFILVTTTTRTFFRNKMLDYGTKYTYKITAISKVGKKNTSKVKTVYTNPEKPVITLEVTNTNNVKVSWKKTKGAVKYKVYRQKAGGKFVLMKTTTDLGYYNKAVAYNTKYTYKVRAVSKAGKMKESAAKEIISGSKPVSSDFSAVMDTSATPEQHEVPKASAETEQPYTPERSTTPSQSVEPEKFSERTATVKVPIYETGTVYWIKSYEGKIIYKSTDGDEWERIWSSPSICIDGVHYDPRVSYGSGQDSEEYKIIIGYDVFTVTETDYYDGTIPERIAAGESIIVIWNDES